MPPPWLLFPLPEMVSLLSDRVPPLLRCAPNLPAVAGDGVIGERQVSATVVDATAAGRLDRR